MSDTSKIFLRNTQEEILEELKDYLPVPEKIKTVYDLVIWAVDYCAANTLMSVTIRSQIDFISLCFYNRADDSITELHWNKILPGENKFRLALSW